jgi:PAS domain S-box-containing protein
LLSSAPAAALRDDFILTKWETEDGLPENSATAMVQTREGYLWFGTFNGLVRTDGQQLQVFDRATTPALVNAGILNLHLAPSGRLWVSTRAGLVSLHQGRWQRHGQDTSWTNRIVRTFAGNAKGVLMATSFDGALCRIEGEQVVELPPPMPPGPPGREGYHGYVDPSGGLWAMRHDFFGRWGGQRWVAVEAAGVTDEFRSSVPARDGGLWVLTKTQLIKLTGGKVERTVTLSSEATNAWSLTEDADGSFWVASHRDGLFHISATGAVTRYTVNEGLTYNSVRFAFRGESGELWVGTAGGGLMRLRPRTVRTFDTETALASRSVKSVVETGPGQILLGTFGGGVARLDMSGQGATLAEAGSGRGLVQALLVDRQGRRWTGHFDTSLTVLEHGVERQIPAEQAGGRNVNALFEDQAGSVWIGGNESAVRHAAGKFERVAGLAGAEGFAQHPVNGGLWAVNRRGLFRLAKDAWQAVPGPGGKPLLEGTCLGFETNGVLWAGTLRDGLFRLQNGKWAGVRVGARHGLASDSVRSMVDDGLGQWWFTSNRGLTRVTRASLHAVAEGRSPRLEAQVVGALDGMGSMECPRGFQPATLRDSAGRLWFATVKGVAMVDPAKFEVNRRVPRVLLESVSYVDVAGNRQVAAVPTNGPVRVPPGSSQFAVGYAAPGALMPERVRFRQTWRSGSRVLTEVETTERVADLTLLPPGNYSLQVTAGNRHGVWGAQPTELAFIMLPHYWQTWWFRLGATLAGLTAVGLGLRTIRREELNRLAVKRAHEQALAEEQGRFASVMEGTSDAVAVITPGLVVQYLNPAGRRMFGLWDAELGAQLRVRELYPLAAAKYVTETALPAALEQGTWSGELHMVRRDGREFPVSQVISAHRNAAGEFDYFSTIIRNLSERKQSEEALAAALKHARLLAELGRKLSEADSSATAGQLVLEAADDLIGWDAAWVRRWHPDKYRFERLLGWDTVDGVRQEFSSTTGAFHVGSPLVREVLTLGAKLILRGKEDESVPGLMPFGGPNRSRSLMFVPMRHAGQVVGVVSVQSYRAQAYTDAHLELLQALADHCAGNLHRIHAEHALRASLDQWRLAMGVARLGTWEWDLHTNVVQHSPELPGMFGGPDVVGPLQTLAEFREFVHPDDRAGVVSARETAIAQRTPYQHEFRVVWQNGSVHWIEGRGEVILDAAGQPARFVGVSADVTERRLSDDALRQSETRFRNLVANMAEGLLMTDFDDVILFANGRVTEILGYTSAELLGHKGYKVFMTDNGREIMAERHQHRRRGESEIYELPLRHKDGRTIWVETHAWAYCDADGKITGTLGAITDVTERKLTQAAEVARTERLRAQSRLLQELATLPVVTGGGFLATSRLVTERMAALLQIERVSVWRLNDDATELRCVDLFERTSSVHSAGTVLTARDFPVYFSALRSGRALDATDAQTDPRTSEFTQPYLRPLDIRSMLDTCIRVAGRMVGVVCHEAVGGIRAWDADEIACCAAVADQLALALLNEQRNAAEVQMRLLSQTLKSTRDCIIVTGLDGRVIFVNDAFVSTYGYTQAEMVGQTAARLRGSGAPEPNIRATVVEQSSWHGELVNRRKDGTEFPIELWVSVVRDDAGQAVATVGVARDITARRQLEVQFRQSQKMEGIGQLAGGVAHDFNNLLTVVQGHIGLLLDRADLAPAARESIGEIGQSATRAANLTRQLLTFSRRQPFKLRLHDLNLVVTGLNRMLQRLVGEHIHMELHLTPQPVGAHADAGMVEQALMNLVVNARDALPTGGTISLTTGTVELDAAAAAQIPHARPGRYVTLTVGDTGVGIAPEVLPHIFEPFFTTKDVGQGTGLGLATVFGIVQQHQGWITVYSEPGHGTTFRLYLPWHELPGQAPAVRPTPLAQAPGGHETLLIVEDEAAVRSFVVKLLTRLGYRVLEAPTGRAALEVWAAHRADIQLLVTDMVMPEGIGGRELAQRLHAERPELPVIYTSGYSAEIAGGEFPLTEGENFLSKPFALSALTALVRRRLDG